MGGGYEEFFWVDDALALFGTNVEVILISVLFGAGLERGCR